MCFSANGAVPYPEARCSTRHPPGVRAEELIRSRVRDTGGAYGGKVVYVLDNLQRTTILSFEDEFINSGLNRG
jgi:hypothetical protein